MLCDSAYMRDPEQANPQKETRRGVARGTGSCLRDTGPLPGKMRVLWR